MCTWYICNIGKIADRSRYQLVPSGYQLVPAGYQLVPAGYQLVPAGYQGYHATNSVVGLVEEGYLPPQADFGWGLKSADRNL